MDTRTEVSKTTYKYLKKIIKSTKKDLFWHSTSVFDSANESAKILCDIGYLVPVTSPPYDVEEPPRSFLGFKATEAGNIYAEQRQSNFRWLLAREITIPIVTLILGWLLRGLIALP